MPSDPAHYKFECFYRPKANNKVSEMAPITNTTTQDENNILKDQRELHFYNKIDENFDPVANFLIALKAPETKRQYPKILEVFFNFIKLEGVFEDKSIIFINRHWKTQNG